MEEKSISSLARKAIAEGSVLLRNENVLPFSAKDKVSVFGRCQIDFYRSGTGSGGCVNPPYVHNLLDGFKILSEEGFKIPALNEKVISVYRDWLKENPFDNGNGEWASEPWFQKEMPLTDEFVREQSLVSNKAVFVLGRTAGEDQDNRVEEGSYLITATERDCIKKICTHFEDVVLLLNVSNVIDLSWIDGAEFNGHIKAVLFCWHGGMEGGLGAADVLCGKQNPSGKLSDTIAYSIDDYASTKNFGAEKNEIYEEDIFTGYRYFSTFAPEKVMFPFGYGLSYTSFQIEPQSITQEGEKFTARVSVKNTGAVPGKETVQVYAECPQGKLGKAKRVLCGWKKTKCILPGETETVTVQFSEYDFSSYDDSGVSGFSHSYVLEEGEYVFTSGNDSVAQKIFAGSTLTVPHTKLIEQCSECCAPVTAFSRLTTGTKKSDGTFEKAYTEVTLRKKNLSQAIQKNIPQEIPFTGNRNIIFSSVVKNPQLADNFVAQFTDEELMSLARGEGMMSRKVTRGIASAFGGVTESLHDTYGIPAAGCSDGPSGVRLDTGENSSLVPIGTLLACTWNEDLVKDIYTFVGKELHHKKIDFLLGPGCNIHRNPLNGRNFEYYSEDPLLSGRMAAATVSGITQGGALATIKHFAANNAEHFRRSENSVVSERALREIYLKPFEIAVKEGGALAVMTSYNALNGFWCASDFDLTRSILRNEWKFSGFVMTDWWASMNDCINGGEPNMSDTASMVKSGTNVYMVVDNNTALTGTKADTMKSALENRTLTRAELQRNAKEIILTLIKTNAASGPLRPLTPKTEVQKVMENVPETADIVSCGEKIDSTKLNCEIYLSVKEDGEYTLKGIYSKESGNEVSQSVSNILLNGEYCGSFESRTTEGKPVPATVGILLLKKGFYRIQIDVAMPGVDIHEICITK